MLSETDRRRVREVFGADDEQLARDHLVSHVLAALSATIPDRILFYGGTALSRTMLPWGRLSEDIDLIALGPWKEVVQSVERILTRDLSREFGRPLFEPVLGALKPRRPATVRFPTGSMFQIQIVPEDHYPAWPFEMRSLEQRYVDVMPTALKVPTAEAFIAWKSVAYMDRRAPRDLWDLAALASEYGFSEQAAVLFTTLGPLSAPPSDSTLPRAPREDVWQRDLAHQTRLRLTAAEARDTVVRAWSTVSRQP